MRRLLELLFFDFFDDFFFSSSESEELLDESDDSEPLSSLLLSSSSFLVLFLDPPPLPDAGDFLERLAGVTDLSLLWKGVTDGHGHWINSILSAEQGWLQKL